MNSDDFRKYHSQCMYELAVLEAEIGNRTVTEFKIYQCKFSLEEVRKKLQDYIKEHISDNTVNAVGTVDQLYTCKGGLYYLVNVSDVDFTQLHRDAFVHMVSGSYNLL